jgi:diguanylate cyclase (GGDEF)-like protein
MYTADDFERKLRESKEKYIKQLPKKISEIKVTWNPLFNKDWNNDLFAKLQMSVNNLAGSGSTFGFPKLSEKARALQSILRKIEGNNKPDILDKVNINNLVDDLQTVELEIFKEVFGLNKTPDLQVPDLSVKSKAIYILDPDVQLTNTLLVQIRYYNYEVIVINDVTTLERKIQEASPVAILIDVEFSKNTIRGRTILQLLQEKYLILCPIIFISNKDDLKARMTAAQASGEDFFTKPIDIGLLLERINALTNNLQVDDPYRILIVDNDEELAKYYAVFLEQFQMKVSVISDPEQMLDTISKAQPELIVLGMYVSNYNGLDLSKVIRQHQSYQTVPILLLSTEKDPNALHFSREIGVDDFLVKPMSGQLFLKSILTRVQRSRFIRAHMTRDTLTGLFAQGRITEHLKVQLSICKRYNRTLAYIILSIDQFKAINDKYGYLMGDRILRSFSDILKRCIRCSDFTGRSEGGEFVIILPEANVEGANIVLQRIQKEFNFMTWDVENKALKGTFCAGVAMFPENLTLEEIIESAELALTEAKLKGGSNIIIR